jgi:predicted ester cyclase
MLYRNPEQVARRYYVLFNERRFEEAELLVSTHAVFRYPHSKEHLIGRAGYRELAQLWVTAFPDGVIEVERVNVLTDHVVDVGLLGRGTHGGPLAFGGALTLPPSNRRAELPMRDVLDIHDGLIVESSFQFDVAEMVRRLTG